MKKSIKFAENLKSLRLAKGYTQKALADMLGVDQRTISAWENGVAEPNFSILLSLCEIFQETLDGLLF